VAMGMSYKRRTAIALNLRVLNKGRFYKESNQRVVILEPKCSKISLGGRFMTGGKEWIVSGFEKVKHILSGRFK